MSHNRDPNLETADHCHTDKKPCLYPVRRINKNQNRQQKKILLKSRILLMLFRINKINISNNMNKTFKKKLSKETKIKINLRYNRNLIINHTASKKSKSLNKKMNKIQ